MDPTLIPIAMQLISQGLTFWADRADQVAKGTLTDADLDGMAAALGANIALLRAEAAAKKTVKPAV